MFYDGDKKIGLILDLISSAYFQLLTSIILVKMKILVVEDEHLIATSIKKGLEQEKYIVDVAFDGLEGYDLASSGDYDLIILDLMLPKIDGLSICRRIRQEKNHTPILMLTAKSQLEDKVVGLDSGADDYLTKPFAFEELLARIRALLAALNRLSVKSCLLGICLLMSLLSKSLVGAKILNSLVKNMLY